MQIKLKSLLMAASLAMTVAWLSIGCGESPEAQVHKARKAYDDNAQAAKEHREPVMREMEEKNQEIAKLKQKSQKLQEQLEQLQKEAEPKLEKLKKEIEDQKAKPSSDASAAPATSAATNAAATTRLDQMIVELEKLNAEANESIESLKQQLQRANENATLPATDDNKEEVK